MIKAVRTFRVRPTLPDALSPLGRLAQNLRWAWHPPTQELFRWADPDVWDAVGGNPVALLGALAPERLSGLAADAAFLARARELEADLERYVTGPRWAQSQDPSPPRVAYFSPEFGITGVMQTYSGGLGVLAGDHLKAASDLGIDLVAVGLLYRHGYFRQFLDADGWQQERYPDLNPFELPLRRLERGGEAATVQVRLAGRDVACQVWQADVGRVPLLLLDTDHPTNAPEDRTVTDRLYGGDTEHRLRQEIVLGIGGVRALELARTLGALPAPDWDAEVHHSNEGHAGFLQLERIRRWAGQGLSFAEAVEAARAGVLFTTHTPVPAGIDVFPDELMRRYFGEVADDCGVPIDELLALGQAEGSTAFNMAVMGLRLSAAANGVSSLHGRVARRMFSHLWPGLATEEVPIASVTNGVHAGTWVGPEMRAVYERHLAPDWEHNPEAWERVGEIPDDVLWRARERARERLVQHVRTRVREQGRRRGESRAALAWTEQIFDPDALTIGFARRFAEYKRGALLLRQPERLASLLSATDRPVQLVFAGKAHPRDEVGKGIIRELVHFAASSPELRTRLVFLEDYDMRLGAVLCAGCDVWLNTPRRPHEACGTSGEKAVLNGALHCSTLDGWWDECYDGENGFAVGSADHAVDVAQQDAADAQSVFDVLERLVVPAFYDRTEGPIPRPWVRRLRRSLQTLGPYVLASRMLHEYTGQLYRPVAAHHRRLCGQGARGARELAAWRQRVRQGWHEVAVADVSVDDGSAELGEQRGVRAVVRLGSLDATDVRVELLHGSVQADGEFRAPTVQPLQPAGRTDTGALAYEGAFVCTEAGEYGLTVRVVPAHPDQLEWADMGLAAWADGVEGAARTVTQVPA